MKEMVMNVLNISGQAAIIFVVLLAVRGIFALGRVPKKYAYALWAILFVRLLFPIQMEARWGLMPQESSLVRAVENMADVGYRQGVSVGGQSIPGGEEALAEWHDMSGAGSDAQYGQPGDVDLQVRDSTAGEPVSGGKASTAERERSNTDLRHPSLWAVVVGIWITGSVLLAGYGFFSYYRLKRMLRCSIRLEGWGEGIYLADGIETPFVLGFMTPQIYLPSDMAEQSYLYVITHERIHIRRRDYLFKLGAYLLTCLYWFHPLVWAGFILMGRDMEMSCDEAVLRRMDGDCRGEYADSLLRLSCEKHYPAAAPLAFGEGDTRGRIKHIMGYRKAAAVVVIAAAA
ncbi:MAG: M56 family metallopeptidase, partial [Acetatifactor sp.]|nr:M56 family metallopeptidase [Acetatifactor sp.]